MRHDATFLVKRFAPMMGRPESLRRISVVYNAYGLADALREAAYERDRHARQPRLGLASFWVEKRGQPATNRDRVGV